MVKLHLNLVQETNKTDYLMTPVINNIRRVFPVFEGILAHQIQNLTSGYSLESKVPLNTLTYYMQRELVREPHSTEERVHSLYFTQNKLQLSQSASSEFTMSGGSSLLTRAISTAFTDRNLNEVERIIKTSLHEVGHMLTLTHCKSVKCVMNIPNIVSPNMLGYLDLKTTFSLCDPCKKKLQTLYPSKNFI